MSERLILIQSEQKLLTQKFINDINENFKRCIYKVIQGPGIDVKPESGQRGTVTISLAESITDGD